MSERRLNQYHLRICPTKKLKPWPRSRLRIRLPRIISGTETNTTLLAEPSDSLAVQISTTVTDGLHERFTRTRLTQLFLKRIGLEEWNKAQSNESLTRVSDSFRPAAATATTTCFFHSSCVDGADFNDLREGQEVTYTVGQGPKGPRAENVRVGNA